MMILSYSAMGTLQRMSAVGSVEVFVTFKALIVFFFCKIDFDLIGCCCVTFDNDDNLNFFVLTDDEEDSCTEPFD